MLKDGGWGSGHKLVHHTLTSVKAGTRKRAGWSKTRIRSTSFSHESPHPNPSTVNRMPWPRMPWHRRLSGRNIYTGTDCPLMWMRQGRTKRTHRCHPHFQGSVAQSLEPQGHKCKQGHECAHALFEMGSLPEPEVTRCILWSTFPAPGLQDPC